MFQVFIDNKEVLNFSGLTITRGVSTFVDRFNIEIANPNGINSIKFPVGALINIFVNSVEIFRGICEVKNVRYNNVGSILTFSGREELVDLTEDELSPSVGDYTETSDNTIIKSVVGERGWVFDLGVSHKIAKYEISNNGIRKGQVIQDVAKLNGYVLIKKGLTLTKTKLPTQENYVERTTGISLTSQGGEFDKFNNRILTVSLKEDISNVKSVIKGYTYGSGVTKPQISKTLTNTLLDGGTYPVRLRNQLKENGTALQLNRTHYISVPVKDLNDLENALVDARRDLDMILGVDITVANYIDLDLLNVIEVFIESEKVKQYMYIDNLSYELTSNNKTTTRISLVPIIPNELI